jgi:hypothetical protein
VLYCHFNPRLLPPPDLDLLAGVLDDFRSMVLRGNYQTIRSVPDVPCHMFFRFPVMHDWVVKSGQRLLPNPFPIRSHSGILLSKTALFRTLLSTHCHLFWLGDLETGTGRHVPLTDFIDSLLVFSERFAQDGDCYL